MENAFPISTLKRLICVVMSHTPLRFTLYSQESSFEASFIILYSPKSFMPHWQSGSHSWNSFLSVVYFRAQTHFYIYVYAHVTECCIKSREAKFRKDYHIKIYLKYFRNKQKSFPKR